LTYSEAFFFFFLLMQIFLVLRFPVAEKFVSSGFYFYFRVKYIFGSCVLRTLFFVPSVLFCTKIGTCGMGKDGNGSSVKFFVQN
jgi:hypothetical protein